MSSRRPLSITLLLASFGFAALVACSSSDPASTGGADTAGQDGGGEAKLPGQSSSDSGTVVTPPPVAETDAGKETHSDGGKNGGDGGGHTDSGGGSGEGGTAGLGQACTTKAQCSAAFPICFTFNAKGKHCTKACATNADCPAGSGGCNGQKVCKVP